MKTIKERITEFREKYSEIDQTHFPKVILTWDKTINKEKKPVFYMTYTGKVSFIAPKCMHDAAENYLQHRPCYIGNYYSYAGTNPPVYYLGYSGEFLRAMYLKEDKKLKVLEASQCIMDTHRAKNGEEIRKWERDNYTSTIYFVDGEKIPYDENGNIVNDYHFSIYRRGWNHGYQSEFVSLKSWVKYITDGLNSHKNHLDFAHFAQNTLMIENGYVINPHLNYAIAEWLSYCLPTSKDGPKALLVTKLNNEIKKNCLNAKAITSDIYFSTDLKTFVYADIIDSYLVFRYISVFEPKIALESYRVFISDKNKVIASRWNGNCWIPCKIRAKRYYYGGTDEKVINPEKIKEFPITKYLVDTVMNNYEENLWIDKIIKLSHSPILEKFLKSKFSNVGKMLDSFCENGEDSKVLSTLFAPLPKTNSSNLCAKTGLNKIQMQILNETFEEYINPNQRYYNRADYKNLIIILKKMLKTNDVSHISAKDFTNMLELCKVLGNHPVFDDLKILDEILETTEDCLKFWKRIYKIGKSIPVVEERGYYMTTYTGGIPEAWEGVRDSLRSWHNLPETVRPVFNIRLKSNSDIKRQHDSLIELNRTNEELIRQERDKEFKHKLELIDKNRKKYEYEDNKYIICLPKVPSDLTYEGSQLHHCVGGYINMHTSGNTTIFFLREKVYPNTPFYTIEVAGIGKTKDIRVVQIHGFGNKWLGNNPEAIPTVMRWLKKNKISCRDEILLSTSKGYCSNGAELVEKPVIDELK